MCEDAFEFALVYIAVTLFFGLIGFLASALSGWANLWLVVAVTAAIPTAIFVAGLCCVGAAYLLVFLARSPWIIYRRLKRS